MKNSNRKFTKKDVIMMFIFAIGFVSSVLGFLTAIGRIG